MNARRPASIVNADSFGFRSDSAVEKSGKTRIRVRIDLGPFPPIEPLAPLTPTARGKAVRRYYRTLYEDLRPLLPSNFRSTDRGYSCIGTLPARLLGSVRRHPSVRSLWLLHVPGREKKLPRPKLEWFAVHARFAIQVENQRRGQQTYEDRIVIVRAMGAYDAHDRLEKAFEDYGRPYLNPYNQLVRWQFEEVVDVYNIGRMNFRDPHLEVYSRLRNRPMRRRDAWIPRGT